MQKIRGTQKEVSQVEVNVDTVYVRSNIVRIDEEDFNGWEYDEEVYNKNNYIEQLTKNEDSDGIAFLLSLMMAELDMLRTEIETLKGV